jgi:Fur family transcriptional regulator, ferric uptake regulator
MTGLTSLRKEIYAIIDHSDIPVNVKSISDRLGSSPNLSTVYRALDYMEKKGLIQSLALFEGIRFYYGGSKHSHFIICSECREIKGFDHCNAETILNHVEKDFDYKITDHVFYFTGLCGDCRKAVEKKKKLASKQENANGRKIF